MESKEGIRHFKNCDRSDGTKIFYPSHLASRRLVLGNLLVLTTNWKFLPVLEGLYAICALLMLACYTAGVPQSRGVSASAMVFVL